MKRSEVHGPGAVAALNQQAALCFRRKPGGQIEVLMITSRETGRWVMPKGWPMRTCSAGEGALREAFEEAGVAGVLTGDCLGLYSYQKVMPDGRAVPCVVSVHPVEVTALADDFPERGQRQRAWFPPAVAAALVAEHELRDLLARFDPQG